LVARLDCAGRVVTGDALYCDRDLCTTIIDAEGDYLVIVKEIELTQLSGRAANR